MSSIHNKKICLKKSKVCKQTKKCARRKRSRGTQGTQKEAQNYSERLFKVNQRRDIQDIPAAEFQFMYGLCYRFASTVFGYMVKRTFRIGSKIWILFSSGKNNVFCHSNIKFIPVGHRVISPIRCVRCDKMRQTQWRSFNQWNQLFTNRSRRCDRPFAAGVTWQNFKPKKFIF